MKKSTLIMISAFRDLLDVLVVGQVPGLNLILSAPVIFLHYRFAGPRALLTLVEAVPVVGTLPFFTGLAISYPDRAAHDPGPKPDARPEQDAGGD